MNILQVISSSRTSGAERHVVILSDWLTRRGHNVLAVCPPGDWLPGQLRQVGIRAVEIPMAGARMLPAALAVRRVAREHHADVIHTHLTRATYMGSIAGLLAHVPVISTLHVFTRDFAYRYLPGRARTVVAVSEHIRQTLIDRGLSPKHVETVYNGTDFDPDDFIAPATALSVRAELGLPADAELVGQVGRVDSFKGAPILVQAARSIVEECPRAHFVFVGYAEPGIQQALWELAAANGVDDRIRFTGVRNDVPRLLEAMEVVTLPSRTEACSMVIIESMAMARPVVATRAGGNLELIDHGNTGLLVERNPVALAAGVSELLRDPDRRAAMGAAAQQRARAMFTAQTMAYHMEDLYRRVLDNMRHARIGA
jgi:glycosyltransferase involved in cell wall biosynthesis